MNKISYKSIKDKFKDTANGSCYKDDEAFESGEGICYIPEHSIPQKGEDDEIPAYTRYDILEICGGNVKLANELYYTLDWQSPELLFEDWDIHGKLDKFCGKDGMIAETPEIKGNYLAVLDCGCGEVIMIKLTEKEQKESEKYDTFEEYVWDVLSERYEFGFDDCQWMITDNPKIRKENYGTKEEN